MPTVKILNPAKGNRWTNVNRANVYVKTGRAEWVNRHPNKLAIKFLERHPT
jgi:hypothetical protein